MLFGGDDVKNTVLGLLPRYWVIIFGVITVVNVVLLVWQSIRQATFDGRIEELEEKVNKPPADNNDNVEPSQ